MADGKKPRSALDRALHALDVGLQSSSEGGLSLEPDLCVHCLVEEHLEGSEYCASCRAVLLEDEPEDPIDFVAIVEEFTTAVAPMLRSWGEHLTSVAVAFMRSIPAELLELALEIEEARVAGLSLGLDPALCMAVIDQEVDRCHESLADPARIPERVHQRLYQLAEAGERTSER